MAIERLTYQLLDNKLYRSFAKEEDWHFLLIEKGAGVVNLDRSQLLFEPGSLFCMPPSTLYTIDFDGEQAQGILVTVGEEDFRTRVIDLLPGNLDRSSSFWRSYYTPRVLPHSVGLEREETRLQIAADLTTLARYLDKGGDPAILGTALVILMSQLSRREIAPEEGDLSRSDAFIKSKIVTEFRVLVEQHFAQQYKVGQYAELLGITSKTLIRACKVMTGSTAVSIIHDRIVIEATQLLYHSKLSVAEIGYSLGFEDAGYFSRFMKEHTGNSPTEIRQQEFCCPLP